ncbi:MAG: D-cysteine desulfhydrase [Bacteroidetes bacterium]|nr:MAG: D-cysteine desulfhydrase [Bacteroidota bacterium]
MITKLLQKIPHLNNSILPTPIHKLENLSKKYDANIYCMRDDLTGFAFGGNKTRKLDYLVYDAMQKGVDTLLSVGANQSNFCRITAAYGAANGLDVQLLLSGEKEENPRANLYLDHLFNAKVKHTNAYENTEVEAESFLLEAELTKQGKKVYRMPLGGSTPLGTLGYLKAFAEILSFSEKNNMKFNSILHASGSGGTQAGLVLGKMISKWQGDIVGISVGRSATELYSVVNNLAKETAKLLNIIPSETKFTVDESYIGEKYGAFTKAGSDAIKEFATYEGILLDNVYTGKAAAGLLDYLEKGKINKSDNILFIHTGGNIELFE